MIRPEFMRGGFCRNARQPLTPRLGSSRAVQDYQRLQQIGKDPHLHFSEIGGTMLESMLNDAVPEAGAPIEDWNAHRNEMGSEPLNP